MGRVGFTLDPAESIAHKIIGTPRLHLLRETTAR